MGIGELVMAVMMGVRASACIVDLQVDDSGPPAGPVFPNWQQTEVTDFETEWCDGVTCPPPDNEMTITGLTMLNYGTATGGAGGDITGMYVCFDCAIAPGPCTPGGANGMTLTYAGVWTIPSGTAPAWTWSGLKAIDVDPCTTCACVYTLRTFADIGPCAVPGRTLILGPGYNDVLNPISPGGLTDDSGCDGPFTDVKDSQPKTVTWVAKEVDRPNAAPGDTVTYTVTYGRPGTTPLTNIIITDSMPPYTHYVAGSAVPPADVGWDPNFGPPPMIRWTLTAGATTGGPTGEVRFSLTVDWGNGEVFEPGSGDVAAPEGTRLANQAAAAFVGTSCATTGASSPPVSTVVKRFLFWKLGDNDLLFAPQPGKPPDEMTYEIFVRNLSPTKTWWNVQIWDSVPAPLDPWAANEGLEDPCNGWTMTPSGCAAASAGRVITAGQTVMTWNLDLPPSSTLTVRWKGQVRPGTLAGATALNRASILAWGQTGVVGGTGSSGVPRVFAHQAIFVLPTTYVSYVGFAADGNDKQGCPGFFISFFPLNKQTQFELRGIQYDALPWSLLGGVSDSIGCLIGDCLSGFPGAGACVLGNGALPGGGTGGCKVERAPAIYDPTVWQGLCPTYPINFIYKVTSNSPVLWQLLTHMSHDAQDNQTFAPATTITYRGLMHYMYRRAGMDTAPGDGDSLSLINTGLDADGNPAPAQPTTVHLFEWNAGSLAWDYMDTYDLGPESQAIDLGPDLPDEGVWRTVSSDNQLVVYQGNDSINQAFCCCGCADNFGAFMANSGNGNVVAPAGTGAFYGIMPGWAGNKMVVTNVGAADAAYRIFRYDPDNPVANGNIPATLADTSGTWSLVASDICPWGFANAANPQVYGGAISAPSYSLWKVELDSGGPIQILFGANMYQGWSGGAVMHASTGNQTGNEYWVSQIPGGGGACSKNSQVLQTVNVFAPKTGMGIQGKSELGALATYTTTGPDQCVSFLALTTLGAGKMNWTFTSLSGAAVIAQYIECKITEKGYTAPFLQTGVHYTIIAPPIVFVGQTFWITVVVVDQTQTTKTDYCGTTSFTSTDPAGKIEGAAMDGYNFTWSSNVGAGCGSTPFPDGVRVFVNVTLTKLGLQTIVATDTADGSITGLTALMVVGADVKLTKEPRLTIGASGDTVTFRVCWSNYSSASAFTFVITDAVPMGTTFLPEAGTAAFNCGSTFGVLPRVAYSQTAQATPPATFTEANPTNAPTPVKWLRFTLPSIDVRTTGCVCYRVSVN